MRPFATSAVWHSKCASVTAAMRYSNRWPAPPVALGEAEVASLADDADAELGRVDPHLVVGLVRGVGVGLG
jgi:hypothetical protein